MTPTVGIYTLGCKVNQYESEAIAEAFSKKGFCVQSPTLPCNVYVINTCTVTAESDRKARQFIRRARKNDPSAYILVTGCFSQTQPEAVSAIDGVDYICGNTDKLSVVSMAESLIAQGKKNQTATVCVKDLDSCGFENMQITHFNRTRAYVKIEDGCESHCTYCIIPSARGKIRSKSPKEVLDEVRTLTENGCREIVLTGIETASFGKDLDGYSLADLLQEIDEIPGVGRIRLGSLDPSIMKQGFVDRIAHLKSLAPHFHLSMQSGSDKILALMKRKYNTKQALDGIERLRRAIPNVQLTTDMIVGFPMETDEDFEQSVSFAKKARFLMIHVFPYSKRAGTLAAAMSGQIPESVKHERVKLLSQTAEQIRKSILDSMTGKTVTVLTETLENGIARGHTEDFVEVAFPAQDFTHAQTVTVHVLGNNGTLCHGEASPQSKGEI